MELKTDVAYTFRVWPACLHQGEDLLGKSLGIAGFGVTDDLGKFEVVSWIDKIPNLVVVNQELQQIDWERQK